MSVTITSAQGRLVRPPFEGDVVSVKTPPVSDTGKKRGKKKKKALAAQTLQARDSSLDKAEKMTVEEWCAKSTLTEEVAPEFSMPTEAEEWCAGFSNAGVESDVSDFADLYCNQDEAMKLFEQSVHCVELEIAKANKNSTVDAMADQFHAESIVEVEQPQAQRAYDLGELKELRERYAPDLNKETSEIQIPAALMDSCSDDMEEAPAGHHMFENLDGFCVIRKRFVRMRNMRRVRRAQTVEVAKRADFWTRARYRMHNRAGHKECARGMVYWFGGECRIELLEKNLQRHLDNDGVGDDATYRSQWGSSVFGLQYKFGYC